MTKAIIEKLHIQVAAYEKLVNLLRETDDDRLVALADSAGRSLAQLNKMLATEVDAKLGREIRKGLRQGLREMPQLLAAVVPERATQVVSEFESKLGHRFSDY